MFADDQTKIAEHVEESGADAFANVATFVFLTIQQPLEFVPTMFKDVEKNGAKSKYLYASKKTGYRYVQKHKKGLYAVALKHVRNNDDRGLILHLATIPGLGLVKAGFLAQLCWGRIGCLDTHNMNRFNLDPKDFNINGVSDQLARKRAAKYIETCQDCGGSEKLWDDWCTYVAKKRNGEQRRLFGEQWWPDLVSKLHLEPFNLGEE